MVNGEIVHVCKSFWCYCVCLDELGKSLGKGTFGKVVECKDLKRLVEKVDDDVLAMKVEVWTWK